MKIAPSLLAADFLHLEKDVLMLNNNADVMHLDVMDGSLVPNISFGFSVLEPLSRIAKIPMDAHLMVVEPQRWFKKLAALGVSMCSFHLEAASDRTYSFIDELHSLGLKAGVAINPDIPVGKLYDFIGKADFLLLMSVFAGFGGQSFIPESVDRVRKLKDEILRRQADTFIEIDGGVGMSNASILREAGVDLAVAGSSVFKAADPAEMIRSLRTA